MSKFGELKILPLRELWPNEASDFTSWLASNIEALGKALGLELELIEREASVGDFSLDLLAKDLGSSRTAIIENQLTQTDHDHLGKLLTYAAGFSASIVIWVSESIRDEHRQALEWLNQRTDTETQFFGVITEVLQIDDSRPAYNFKPVVFPNEWQKSKKPKTSSTISSKGEKYRSYFQSLIDELRENYRFTGAKAGQPQSWYSFSTGIKGVLYGANFAMGGKARTEIYIDQGDYDQNKNLFDALQKQQIEIENEYGSSFEWGRLDDKRSCRIALYCNGTIEASDSELEQLRKWHIENLLKLKNIFMPFIQRIMKQQHKNANSDEAKSRAVD
ncbi:MAG: DUF4268 domain-containing protein [Desulfobacteraceae bacterium]|nr:MAG: DUF4268 domain-containing protein [Desulfobacteraceae bacterium]